MSLLHDIQRAAIEPKSDLPTLLRMCKLLAARLGNNEFGQWVEYELNGYPNIESMPEYRIIDDVQSFGNFQAGFGATGSSMPIPLSVLPKEAREQYAKVYMGRGVSTYAALLSEGDTGSFEEPWPIGAALKYGSDAIPGFQCIKAWKSIPRGAFIGFLDQVKTRVLGFAIEIERQAPSAGESPLSAPPLKQEVVTHIFHTQIGNVQNYASGNNSVSQSAGNQNVQGDFAPVEAAARDIGLNDADIKELRDAMEQDSRSSTPAPFEGKTGGWLSKTMARAAKGGLKVGVAVATEILAKAIAGFFGL